MVMIAYLEGWVIRAFNEIPCDCQLVQLCIMSSLPYYDFQRTSQKGSDLGDVVLSFFGMVPNPLIAARSASGTRMSQAEEGQIVFYLIPFDL